MLPRSASSCPKSFSVLGSQCFGIADKTVAKIKDGIPVLILWLYTKVELPKPLDKVPSTIAIARACSA